MAVYEDCHIFYFKEQYMKNLKIYYISESYINYLRQFDKNVAYNNKTIYRNCIYI